MTLKGPFLLKLFYDSMIEFRTNTNRFECYVLFSESKTVFSLTVNIV